MTAVPALLTYADAIDLLVDFMAGQGVEVSQPAVRRAIHAAYEDIANAHRWGCLSRHGRIFANARYTTGTALVYDHTGGSNEREATLTGGVFPSWAADGAIRFGSSDLVCDVQTRESDTVVTLNAVMNPGQDVTATSYVLYQRWIRLPSDFLAFTGPFTETSWQLGEELSLGEMLGMDRYNSSSGDTIYFSVGEVPDLYGQKALYIYPQMDSLRSIDFSYLRQPRELRYSGHDAADYAGTITVTAGSDALTGTTTSFTSSHVGSIVRIGTSGTVLPSGRFGESPFSEERSILAVSDATNATLDADVTTSRSDVKYRITDPIDIGRVAHNAFLRLAEKHLAIARKLEHFTRISDVADRALLEAMGADNPVITDPSLGHAGYGRGVRSGLGDVSFD